LNVYFKLDNSAVVAYVNRLEKLKKSALPNAIRNTLNSAAFDVKQNTMPSSADKNFVKRKPNFFKANSKVVMAKSGDVKSMKAVVGFTSSNAQYNNFAVEELEQQEHGGRIGKRTLIPLDFSRSGQSHGGQVLPSNRVRVIKNIIHSTKSKGRNKRQQFIKAAIYAGKNGLVIGNIGSRETLFRVKSIKKDANGKTVITKTPLYSYQKGRSIRIKKATHFMREASYKSARRMNEHFIREAKKQIQYIFK
jgi:hypothetical protein